MGNINDALLKEAIEVYLTSLKYLDNFVSEPAKAYGLSFEQYLILHTIATRDKVSLMDIANERQVTRSAISRQIKVLLNHDYIYQEPAQSDRRRLYLHLSDEGQEVEKKVTDIVAARFDDWINDYGSERARDIIDFIKDFANRKMGDVNKFSE